MSDETQSQSEATAPTLAPNAKPGIIPTLSDLESAWLPENSTADLDAADAEVVAELMPDDTSDFTDADVKLSSKAAKAEEIAAKNKAENPEVVLEDDAGETTVVEPAKVLSMADQAKARNQSRLKEAREREAVKRADLKPVAPVAEPAKPEVVATVKADAPSGMTVEEFQALAKRNPIKALERMGVDPAEFTSQAAAISLNIITPEDDEPAVDPVTAKLLTGVEALQAKLDALQKREDDRVAADVAARREVDARNAALTDVAERFETLAPKFPLASAAVKSADVWDFIENYHEAWKSHPNYKILTVAQAMNQIEQTLKSKQPKEAAKAAPTAKSDEPVRAKSTASTTPKTSVVDRDTASLSPEARRKQFGRLANRIADA